MIAPHPAAEAAGFFTATQANIWKPQRLAPLIIRGGSVASPCCCSLLASVLCHQCDGIGCFLRGAASGISLLLFLLYIQFAALRRPASLPWQLSAHYRFHVEHRRGCTLLVYGGAQ